MAGVDITASGIALLADAAAKTMAPSYCHRW